MRLRPLDREIFGLAVPALGALIAEPLFLITDTALIGHLGEVPLAGLSIASAILQTAVGLLVFLAYATTPMVARRLGAGDRPGAIRAGIDGLWLAIVVGAVLLVVGFATARQLIDLFGADAAVSGDAATYLLISVLGLPAMLIVLAATGLLRGLQDTRTPLVVAVVGFIANGLLNALLIYGFGLGIAGSALGTVIAQWGMATVYLVIAVRAARATGVSVKPGLSGVSGAATSGGWLLLRTASLRAALLATVVVGTDLGVTELATLQIAMTVFGALALGLDALAIAGQAMIGHGLGSAQIDRVIAITRRLMLFGVVGGAGVGVVLAALSGVAGSLFTTDASIREALSAVLVVMAVGLPLAGYVFVLDGVLIGAGDARYLALSGLVNLAVYAPLLWLAWQSGSLLAVWTAFGIGYIAARAVTLGVRARGTRWIVTGSERASESSRGQAGGQAGGKAGGTQAAA